MINKTKYTVLILSANIFLCSAEKECEFLKLFTTKKQENIENNDTNIELPEILQKEMDKITNIETTNVKTTKKNETKLDKDKKKEEVITLKMLLDYGLTQKANEAKEESVEAKEKSVDEIRIQNLKTIETLIKGFELSRLPNILKKLVNTKSLIDAYEKDGVFQNLSCVEQMKLVLMFWCLQYGIEFDFQNETIEQFTKKITYSNIKKILNDKIDELINKEKNTKEGTSEGNIPEEDSKNWESYKIFKIDEKEKIKDLFYFFIKECILTSIAILIHKYCALCKDKFGEVFIGDGKVETIEYSYTQNSWFFKKSDDEDTIAQTQNLFSKNSKYTRICNISFEDITTLIGILTKLPNFNDFSDLCSSESNNEANDKKKVAVFQNYKKLLDFVTQKKNGNEKTLEKNKFDDSVHFYDIMKFFDMEIDVNNINSEKGKNDKTEDLEIVFAETFGKLVDKIKNNIDGSLKNIKNITFNGGKSKHKVLNLSFAKCRFINPNIDINELIEEEKTNENEDSNENSDEESI